jgi:hypothetical protein
MFKQTPSKVEANPLRQKLAERGHSVRSAAKALGISPAEMVYRLDAHDARNDFAERVKALEPRAPAKLRARVATRKTKKATAA